MSLCDIVCHCLLKIFPLIRSWGATGLLVEYEDMFPYSGALRDIAAPNVYKYGHMKIDVS